MQIRTSTTTCNIRVAHVHSIHLVNRNKQCTVIKSRKYVYIIQASFMRARPPVWSETGWKSLRPASPADHLHSRLDRRRHRGSGPSSCRAIVDGSMGKSSSFQGTFDGRGRVAMACPWNRQWGCQASRFRQAGESYRPDQEMRASALASEELSWRAKPGCPHRAVWSAVLRTIKFHLHR